MKAATLYLYYFVKYLELAITMLMTALILSSGIWLVEKIRDQVDITDEDIQLMSLVIASMYIVVMNLFFNLLLSNLRLLAKINCTTLGLCIFDCPNNLCCFKFLRYPCQNRLRDCRTTTWFMLKWLISGIMMGYTILEI